MKLENVINLKQLFVYFDELIDFDCDDQLFASSYLRGFLEVAAVNFGDLQQPLMMDLYHHVDAQILAAQNELSEQDKHIVITFWQSIKPSFK